jgi:hypothetical protein
VVQDVSSNAAPASIEMNLVIDELVLIGFWQK